jgi:hypothetical protein
MKPRYDGRIYKWVKENDIKVESGVNYGFDDYKFLLEPLMDMHPKQVSTRYPHGQMWKTS